MSETPESRVKRKTRTWVKEQFPGSWHYAPRGGPFGKIGIPDDMWLWRGVLFVIEAKADRNNQPTEMQWAQLKWLKRMGAVTAVLYGYELDKLWAIHAEVRRRAALIDGVIGTLTPADSGVV